MPQEISDLLEKVKSRYPQLNTLQEGEDFDRLLSHFKQDDLAKELGVSRGYIGQRVRIHTKLIPDLKELVKSGVLPYWEAYQLSGDSQEKQGWDYESRLKSMAEGEEQKNKDALKVEED